MDVRQMHHVPVLDSIASAVWRFLGVWWFWCNGSFRHAASRTAGSMVSSRHKEATTARICYHLMVQHLERSSIPKRCHRSVIILLKASGEKAESAGMTFRWDPIPRNAETEFVFADLLAWLWRQGTPWSVKKGPEGPGIQAQK
jgi:hypothetical protein